MSPKVETFFHEDTFTASHIAWDQTSGSAAIIDPVLEYDPKSGRTSHEAADAIIRFVREKDLDVAWILETHVHADHLTAAPYIKEQLGGATGIGEHVRTVQETFKSVFNAEPAFATDGSQFDKLFADGDIFSLGEIEGRVIHTPGHTPACVTYLIGDAAFVGDTLFMPDFGTARVDFPAGDAEILYGSIQKIFALPDETRLFMCHDYKAPGRDVYAWQTTVAEERSSNIHVHDGVDKAAFVDMRTARDRTLSMPVLILPSVQVNIRAGRFPPPEDNGVHYLKIPMNLL